MKKQAKKIIIPLIAVILVICQGMIESASAEDGRLTPAEMSASIFKKINEYRAEPYKKIIEFAEAENIKDKLPVWVEDLKDKSFPALDFNPELLKTSSSHIDDMASKNYFSEINPDGKGVSERLNAAGIPNSVSRESIGIVLFRNYIDPALANESIFKAIIKYEIAKPTQADSLIFNGELTEAAVSVKPEAFLVQGRMFNSYIAVCDAAGSDLMSVKKKIAGMLSVMINQARMKPVNVLEAYGYFGDFSSELTGFSYPSLNKIDFDAKEFAKYGINRLPETGYYVISKNDSEVHHLKNKSLTLSLKDLSAGYSINSITNELFRLLLDSELINKNSDKMIFNPELNRQYLEVSIQQKANNDLTEVIIDLDYAAWHEDDERLEASGVVYEDLNLDGLYNPGEEKAMEQIYLFSNSIYSTTDSSGAYYLNDLETLSFLLVIFDEEKGLVFREKNSIENGKFCFEDLND